MTLNEFIDKFFNKPNVGNTPENKGECVGLSAKWIEELGFPHVWGHAKDLLNNADKNSFKIIKNTPQAVAQAGDIIVWDKTWGNGYGHTGVCVTADIDELDVFEQNNPLKAKPHIVHHINYSGIIGWLRPNRAITAQPTAQEFTDQTLIPSLLLTSKDYPVPQALEIQQLRGLLGAYGRLQRDYDGMLAQAHDLKRQLKESLEAYKRLLNAPDGPKTTDYSVSELITMLLKKILAKLPT